MTVKDPWAYAIAALGKDVENRTRNIAGSYRGPVAIHAAAGRMTLDAHFTAAKYIAERTGALPLFTLPGGLGVIISVVDLVDVHPDTDCWRRPWKHESEGWCTPWAMEGHHHLVLANARRLAEPIPYKGALGLRTLDAETVARVEAAIV
ncbi:hypothetical protein J2X03_003809 [Microbacterium trichothecenolyticum]|uniref:hypothetical protein n=1 Tax=Microbacterium trichothecenolyticum TaxID=69370 RepID=UPI002854A19F|nr:hypothetical protein [Microbacterium trichothecenolyticum]MDR7113907.1 hypothetical protein [Microbacterium trichothecenolyticum]